MPPRARLFWTVLLVAHVYAGRPPGPGAPPHLGEGEKDSAEPPGLLPAAARWACGRMEGREERPQQPRTAGAVPASVPAHLPSRPVPWQ